MVVVGTIGVLLLVAAWIVHLRDEAVNKEGSLPTAPYLEAVKYGLTGTGAFTLSLLLLTSGSSKLVRMGVVAMFLSLVVLALAVVCLPQIKRLREGDNKPGSGSGTPSV